MIRHGEPEQALALAETEPPEPGPGQVRIRVTAAALGLPDVFMCRGTYAFRPELPFTPGQEVAGMISAVGPDVAWEPGDRVVAVTAFYLGRGGFAEETLAETHSVFPAPGSLSDAEAAAFLIPYQTGWIGLVERAALRPGECLLVHGGAGGTGAAAIALGRALGARVLATAGGPDKVALCRELGAELAIDHREADFVQAVREATDGRGADIIYDPVGGEVFERSLECIASGGRLLAIGSASGRFGRAPVGDVLMKNCSVVGVFVGAYDGPTRRRMHDELVALLDSQGLRPLVGAELPFDALPQGLARLAARESTGRQILLP